MTDKTVTLDILSDPICPWCYIGKTHLDRALATVPTHPFVIQWHPFRLNPEMPAEGMSRQTYIETKFGGAEGAARANAPVIEHAQKAGLPINLDAITRSPSTLDAHRLIHWAGIERKQMPTVDALFQAYFVDGRDIGDHEVLADIADGVGLDASLVLRLLASDADRDDIIKRDTDSREMGVTSVPTFIVAGKHAVPGAQPPELWRQVIEDLNKQLAEPVGS